MTAVLLDDALERIPKLGNGVETAVFDRIQLGSSAATPTDTTLHGCVTPITTGGLAEAQGTVGYEAPGHKLTVEKEFICTIATAVYEYACRTSDGKGLIRDTYGTSPKNLAVGDRCTWTVKISFAEGT